MDEFNYKGLAEVFEEFLETYIATSLTSEKEVLRQKFYTAFKVGAVLNRKNKARLETALEAIEQVLNEAGDTEESSQNSGEVESNDNSQNATGFDADEYFRENPNAEIPQRNPALFSLILVDHLKKSFPDFYQTDRLFYLLMLFQLT